MPRKKGLSEDDRVVWHAVSQTVEPLRPAEMPEVDLPVEPPKPPKPVKTLKSAPKAKPAKKIEQAPAFTGADPTPTSPNMDRRNFQRLVRGKMELDATIDLHGLSAAEAQTRLRAFVLQAHQTGCRTLLVITGKGTKAHPDEFGRPRAGVIRQSLPDWLTSSSLRDKVLQVTSAQPKHGGKGAFYVHLRRKR